MKISIVIGTYRDKTLKQLDYLADSGIKPKNLDGDVVNDIDLYAFRLNTDYKEIDEKFIKKLSNYDYIIISGGETAFYILNKANFVYIENKKNIMPLISKGIVKGGILNNKRLVLKGGNIGDSDIYLKIIDCMVVGQ